MKRIINAETILQNGVPVSSGSGVEYVNTASPIVSTTTNTPDTWADVTNASVTVTPTEANEKWEIRFEGSLYMGSDDGSNITANVRIVDSSNNLIDDALVFVAVRHYSAGSGAGFPIALVARDTISAPKTYKVQIRMSANGSDIGIYNGNITGDLSGDDSKAKFWAEKKTLGDNGGGGSALTVQDEGSTLSAAVTKINFVGAGVTATEPVADEITVTIPSAGWTTVIKTDANNNETITNNTEVAADTSTAAFALNLPATPTIGQRVRFSDKKGTWTTNNLTIGRNGSNINGAASNFILNVSLSSAEFVFTDATDGWIVLTS